MQVGTEYGFHSQLPTRLDPQPFSQSWTLGQLLFAQPLGSAGARIERGLLQGFQRGQPAIQALQIALGLLLCLIGLMQLAAQLFQALDQLFFAGVQLFQGHFAGGEFFAEFENRRVFRVCGEQLSLFAQTPLPFAQSLHAAFQLLNARLLHFGLTPWFGRVQIESVPLFLPAVHGAFGVLQCCGGLFGGCAGDFLFGLEHFQLFA